MIGFGGLFDSGVGRRADRRTETWLGMTLISEPIMEWRLAHIYEKDRTIHRFSSSDIGIY